MQRGGRVMQYGNVSAQNGILSGGSICYTINYGRQCEASVISMRVREVLRKIFYASH